MVSSLSNQLGSDERGEFKAAKLSEEEIAHHAIPDNLSEAERIKVLLSKKDFLQQSYVFANALNIFKNDSATQLEIIPVILSKLVKFTEALQVEAGEMFDDLLENKVLDSSLMPQIFKSVMQMLALWSKEVLEIWIVVYARLLPILMLQNTEKQQKELVEQGVQLVRDMSAKSQPIQVKLSSALLMGALAEYNSLKSPERFMHEFGGLIKKMCQNLSWELRRDMGRQLFQISMYVGPQISLERIYPELIELIDDEEQEVAIDAFTSFADHVAHVYRTPPFYKEQEQERIAMEGGKHQKEESKQEECQKNVVPVILNREDHLKTFKDLFDTFGRASNEKAMLILERSPILSLVFADSTDLELVGKLQAMLSQWVPFEGQSAPTQQADDYELQHVAMGLKYLSKLFRKQALKMFYEPCYKKFIAEELEGDKTLYGAKMQIAEIYHEFIEYSCESGQGASEADLKLQMGVLDQYFELFNPAQHKDVISRTLEGTPRLIEQFLRCNGRDNIQLTLVQPDSGVEFLSEVDTKLWKYFEKHLKMCLNKLELSISNDWRLHKQYFQTVGAFALHTESSADALFFVQSMLGALKGKTRCSLPVKKTLAEQLARIIACKADFKIRQEVTISLLDEFAAAKSSQQRHVFLLYLEALLPQISSRHFKQEYFDAFYSFKDEQVNQMVIYYARLVPLARQRLGDGSKAADRLELSLRNLMTRYNKRPRSELVLDEVVKAQQTMATKEYRAEIRRFTQNDESLLLAKEIRFSKLEAVERSTQIGASSHHQPFQGVTNSMMSQKTTSSQKKKRTHSSNKMREKSSSAMQERNEMVPMRGMAKRPTSVGRQSLDKPQIISQMPQIQTPKYSKTGLPANINDPQQKRNQLQVNKSASAMGQLGAVVGQQQQVPGLARYAGHHKSNTSDKSTLNAAKPQATQPNGQQRFSAGQMPPLPRSKTLGQKFT